MQSSGARKEATGWDHPPLPKKCQQVCAAEALPVERWGCVFCKLPQQIMQGMCHNHHGTNLLRLLLCKQSRLLRCHGQRVPSHSHTVLTVPGATAAPAPG